MQSQTVVLALGDYMNVSCHACIGGTSVGEDIRKLEQGQQIVSGTPGRVYDMIRRRNLRTKDIKMLILDESDELLNKGFKDQIYDIYRYLPPGTQVCFSSVVSCCLPLMPARPSQNSSCNVSLVFSFFEVPRKP